jgi:hypothetical protein
MNSELYLVTVSEGEIMRLRRKQDDNININLLEIHRM